MYQFEPTASPNEAHEVSIASILCDPSYQVRQKIDPGTVRRYANIYRNGGTMNPVTIAKVNETVVLVDGWHRIAALESLGHHTVCAVVVEATEKEARWMAAKANMEHGLPLKASEYRNAFKAYIRAKQHLLNRGRFKSYRQIAQELGGQKNHTTIRNWMKEDFPKIAQQYRGDDTRKEQSGLADKTSEESTFAVTARDALNTALAAFRGIEKPEDRGTVIELAEKVVKEMKAGEPWVTPVSDF